MADHGPISPSGPGSSKFRDVTRTVSTEAATHLDRLKKSERTKQVVDKTVDWTAEALEDVEGTANRLKAQASNCLLYTSPSPRDATLSRMPSSA